MSFGSFNTFNTLIQSVKIFLNPPTIVIPTVSSSIAVSVAFTAPGGTITSYTVSSNPSGFTGTGSSSPITVSGLSPNTTYTFTVTATNTGGTSVASSASSAVTTISGSPTIIGLLQQLLVNKPPYGRYSASSWVQGTLTLTDETGNGRNGVGTGALTQTSATGNGATASIPYIQGITTDKMLWPTGSIATAHTICCITRYASGVNQQRLMTASGDNVILGHHISKRGVVFSGGWRTNQVTVAPTTDWMNFCYTNGSVSNPLPNNILVNGVGQGTQVGGTVVVSQLGVNIYPGEFSDFQIAQLLIWDQVLTPAELVIVSNAYTQFLTTGILLSPTVTVSSSTTVRVDFTAPSGGNGTITSYTVTSSPGGLTGTGSSSPITVSGLSPNTIYTFTVSATNSGGTSVASSASSAVTTISGSPTIFGLFQQLLVNKPAWGRYSASSWVQGTLTLTDETGNGRNGVGTGALTQTTASGNGATVAIPYIQGIISDTILWPAGSIPTLHTICFITRYTGSINQHRILTSNTQNYVIGHHVSKRGVVAVSTWLSSDNTPPTTDWLNMCYTNALSVTNPTPNNVLVNGVATGTTNGGDNVVSRLGINIFTGGEPSDFQIAQLLIWNQALTPAELVIVSNAYTHFLATGILLSPTVTVSSSTAVRVDFTAPSGGNGTITSYTVTSSPGGLTGTGSSSPISVSGLTPNTIYTFTVSATNLGGTSVASSASTAATTIPSPPTSLISTVVSSTSVRVAFTSPSGTGTITSYTVTSSPGGLTGTSSSSPIVVSGLTPNTSYTFSVTSTNTGGTSVASTGSSLVSTCTFRVKSSTSIVPTSVDGYTLTNNSGVTMVNDATRGFVFNFNGGTSLSLNLATPIDSTKTFWVSSSTPSNNNGNVFSTTKLPIWFNATTFLRASVNFDSGVNVISTLTQTSTWSFYAITTTATTTSLYVNGVVNATVNVNWTGDTSLMYFGAFQGANFFTGLIDDIIFYSKILTPTEIQTLYTNTLL